MIRKLPTEHPLQYEQLRPIALLRPHWEAECCPEKREERQHRTETSSMQEPENDNTTIPLVPVRDMQLPVHTYCRPAEDWELRLGSFVLFDSPNTIRKRIFRLFR